MSDQRTIPPQTPDKGDPDSPVELPPQSMKEGLQRAVQQFKADKGTLISAGMAFYWFLAVFPAILAAVGIFGLVNAGEQLSGNLTKAIQSALPGEASRILTETLSNASQAKGSSLAATLIGIALALWSASAGMVALQTGLDVVYKVPEERTFLKKRTRAFVLIVVFVVLGGIATAAIVFGAPLGDALEEQLPIGGGLFVVLWTLVRWTVGLAALAALFACFYYFGPNRETPKWTWLSPGGVVGAIIWLLASVGFSFYVSSLGKSSYGKTYGSFSGVVILLLWMFLTAIAVVLGGEVNAGLEREAEDHRQERRGSMGGRRQQKAEAQTTKSPAATMQRPAPGSESTGDGDGAAPSSYEQQWVETMRRLREGSDRDRG